ncbi:hypothetical protein LSUCC1028_00360 [Rhodobacterales bacterium LSUCC1028]|nr:hypothetical protein [Rhodobacterales bacterium LSUCC1028]
MNTLEKIQEKFGQINHEISALTNGAGTFFEHDDFVEFAEIHALPDFWWDRKSEFWELVTNSPLVDELEVILDEIKLLHTELVRDIKFLQYHTELQIFDYCETQTQKFENEIQSDLSYIRRLMSSSVNIHRS